MEEKDYLFLFFFLDFFFSSFIIESLPQRKKGIKMKNIKKASEDYSFNLIYYLVNLLKSVGYYSFNRYMVKRNYNLKFCLAIHKIAAKNS